MRRRQFLAALPAVVAGCSGGAPTDAPNGSDGSTGDATGETAGTAGPTTTGSPASSGATTSGATDETASTPRDVETPAPGECEPTRPEADPPGWRGPTPYPEPPSEFTDVTVRSYVRYFEAAYVENRKRIEGTSEYRKNVEVRNTDFSVERTEAGYRVQVDLQGVVERIPKDPPPRSTNTHTPTPVPSITIRRSATYYLTERYAIRVGIDDGNEVRQVVACFDR